mmetsp:Transcript_14788/g.59211  ORF Transcript_14788/g.59211 Transcript_14788/m.59211 type:complete len:230 (+) Transcript_14788:227-916(+)
MSWLSCCWRSSIFFKPSASAMCVAMTLWPARLCALASASPTLRMFSSASSATMMILTSATERSSQSGGMHAWDTRNLICCGVPPDVAFEIAHAASLRMSNSAEFNSCTSGGMMFASMTPWIWSLLPAVMFEMVQHASLRMPFLGLPRRLSRHGSAEKLMMICVWRSSPVTMLPTVRSAGVCTDGDGCMRSSTRRRHTPASMTAWIFSFGPSDRYDRAQHASVSTSSSGE